MHNSDPEGLLMKRVFTSLRAFLVLFIVLYLLFLSSLVLPDRSFSESENKYLSPLPAISFRSILNGSFMEKYDNYVSDQFPVRDAWIRIKSLTESVLMKTENNGVVFGKDGYLFQRFTYDSKVLEENINAIDTLGNRSSVPVSVLIVPSSYTVLSDKLPDGVVLADQRSYLEHGESGPIGTLLPHCSVIDVLSVLDRHNDEYIYYRTDHHWTTYGAWYAYNLFCASNGLDATVPDEKASHTTEGFLGTSYYKCLKAGQRPDTLTYYDCDAAVTADGSEHESIYDLTKLNTRDKYSVFLYGNGAERRISSPPGVGKKANLLVIKDSYADCMIPFLCSNYENITCVDPRYYSGSFETLVSEGYDDILIIFGFEDLATETSLLKLGF